MRQDRIIQASIFDVFAPHEIGRELRAMSQWLDRHRQLLSAVAADLRRHGLKQTGRHGLPAEAVLRCGLLKQYRQLSYEELAFHLQDSASFRAFARLPVGWCPKKSVLHKTISAVRAETWEQINRVLLASAKEEQIESGAVIRLDSTTSAALLHEPSDSSLLWDAVRVMVRLLQQADELCAGAAPAWHSHRRLAKRRALAIKYSRSHVERVKLYRELIAVTRATLGHLQVAAAQMPMNRGLAGRGAALPAADRADHCAERAARAARRDGAGARETGQPVRDACRHHSQGQPRAVLWAQAQPDQRQERPDPRPGDRGRQPGGQCALRPHAGSPHRLLWRPPASDGGRWWLCHARQSRPSQGQGCRRCRLPQEARPDDRGHGEEPLGLSQAAQLPRRYRGRHLLPQARLWLDALHMARPRALQGLRLVFGCRLQSRPPGPPQAVVAPPHRDPAAAPGKRRVPNCAHKGDLIA